MYKYCEMYMLELIDTKCDIEIGNMKCAFMLLLDKLEVGKHENVMLIYCIVMVWQFNSMKTAVSR